MDAAEQWVSLRAYARHRKVALSAVQKAIESGRVTAVRRDGDRLMGINLIEADKQWLANTDPDQAARTKGISDASPGSVPVAGSSATVPPAPASPSREEPAAEPGLPPSAEQGKDFGYLEHRAKREEYQAKQAELDYLEAIGELVPKSELIEAAVRRYRSIRDKLQNIPDRLSAILAAEKEPAAVHAALAKEIKQVLHELSDDARAEAARGAAERLAA